jgi:hypothetical protein
MAFDLDEEELKTTRKMNKADRNEIEVGEYVRTKDGRIAQIKSIDYEAGIYRFDRIIYINDFRMKEDVLYSNEMFKKVIVRHSKQLIDLIEVGDFVNGYKVISVDYDVMNDTTECIELDLNSNYQYNFISIRQIKTILTKEQFETNCYEIKEEE